MDMQILQQINHWAACARLTSECSSVVHADLLEKVADHITSIESQLEAAEKQIGGSASRIQELESQWENRAPTPFAYEAACSALNVQRERAEAVEAMTADVVRDANRYRFLRDKDCFGEQDAPGLVSADDIFDLDTGDFDAAVDGRMAAADIPFFNPVKLVLSTEDSEWKKRAEAAEARLLNPIYQYRIRNRYNGHVGEWQTITPEQVNIVLTTCPENAEFQILPAGTTVEGGE